MEQEYNIGDLWQWARSGAPSSFTLTKNGDAVCQVIRVNGDGMDWLYAQYKPDNGTFTVPFKPFGMWGWPERMCVVREEYAGLGNWSLPDAERRLNDAYRAAVAEVVQAEADKIMQDGGAPSKEEQQAADQLGKKLEERGISPENWATAGFIKIELPQYYPGALFLDEGGEIGRILDSVKPDDPRIQHAAHTVAALLGRNAPEAPAKSAEQTKKPDTAKPEPDEVESSAAESPDADESPTIAKGRNEQAKFSILQALNGLKVHKLKFWVDGDDDYFGISRTEMVRDLNANGCVQPSHLTENRGTSSEPIPARTITRITKLNGKDVLYERDED